MHLSSDIFNMLTRLFCFVSAASVLCDINIGEPICSRFDFEYKMIERLVKLEQKSTELEVKCTELQKIVDDQGEELQSLKKGMYGEVIAEIKLPTKQTLADGDTIIFTHPVVNTGNAYNTGFGFFEPLVNGTYSFSSTVCTYPDTWMVFGLMKDNDVIDEIIVGDPGWHQCATSTAVTYVTPKNKVWVKVLRTHHGVIDKDYGISSFTGVLLNARSL